MSGAQWNREERAANLGAVKGRCVSTGDDLLPEASRRSAPSTDFPTPPGVGRGAGAADILRMVANQHSIKTNWPNSESFIMSNWTSKDVAVKDAAFARLLKVICGETNECSRGVRHVTLYCLFSQTQRPSPRQPPFRNAPNPPPLR